MFKLLFLFLIVLSSIIFSLDDEKSDVVDTEALFRDPSLSLERNSNFVNFQYLSKAPEFVAPIVGGGNFQLGDYVGDLETNEKLKRYYERYQDDPRKTLILVFFASYCDPCKYQIPEILDINQTLYSERNDIQLVFIGMDANMTLVNEYIRNQRFELPENSIVVLNPTRNQLSPSTALNVTKLPSLFVINRQGEIILEQHGYKRESNLPLILETIVNNYEGIEKYSK